MKKYNCNFYMALLLAVCLMAGATMAVGTAQARIVGTTAAMTTVLRTDVGKVTSNCLRAETNQIILLGDMESEKTLEVPFTLKADREISDKLTCEVTEGAPVTAVMALQTASTVEIGEETTEPQAVLSEDMVLTMAENSEATVVLTIATAAEITQSQSVDVTVRYGGLVGIFRIGLIADPVEAVSAEEDEETSESEEEDPTEPTESVTPTEPTKPDLPSEPGEGVGTTSVTTNTDGTDQTTDEPVTDPTAEIAMTTLESFDAANWLPVMVTASGDLDRIQVGLLDGGALPALTRYSTDGGVNWYQLYFGGYLELTDVTEEEKKWVLLLDFSGAALTDAVTLNLEADALLEEDLLNSVSAETTAEVLEAQSVTTPILKLPKAEDLAEIDALLAELQKSEEPETEQTEQNEGADAQQEEATVTDGETEDSTAVTEPAVPAEPQKNCYFEVPLPIGWTEDALQCALEVRTRDAVGIPRYEDCSDSALNTVIDSENGALIVYMGAQPPAAGTYRLTLNCVYEGTCFYRTQIIFFINDSTRSDAQNKEVSYYD